MALVATVSRRPQTPTSAESRPTPVRASRLHVTTAYTTASVSAESSRSRHVRRALLRAFAGRHLSAKLLNEFGDIPFPASSASACRHVRVSHGTAAATTADRTLELTISATGSERCYGRKNANGKRSLRNRRRDIRSSSPRGSQLEVVPTSNGDEKRST